MSTKDLPTERYLWQCETCQRVMDIGPVGPGSRSHLKPAEDHDERLPWCTGVVRRFTYRLVTQSDYTLRA